MGIINIILIVLYIIGLGTLVGLGERESHETLGRAWLRGIVSVIVFTAVIVGIGLILG